MKEFIVKIRDSAWYRRVFAVLCLLVLAYPLYISLVELERQGDYLFLLQAVTGAAVIMLLPYFGKKIPVEGKLLGACLLWALFTRILLGDLGNSLKGSLLFLAGACCLFCVGSLLDARGRRKLLNWTTGILCGLLFFWAACGLLIVLKGSGYLPLVHDNIFLMDEFQNGHHVRCLIFYNLHRNETAPWFMIALWLMVYQWFACEKKLWRIPIGLAGVLFYVAVALQHCRTVYLATAGGCAMLALLLLKPRADSGKPLRRWALAILAAVLCLAVSYKSFSVCNTMVSETAKVTGRIYNQIRGYEQPQQEAEAGNSFVDDRDLLRDMKTATGRMSIWRAVYRTRKADAGLAILGQAEGEVIPFLMERGGLKYEAGHTHNMFMQALCETGIPGMLLYLAFTVILVLRMLRMFFRRGVTIAKQCMTIPLAALLVYGMMEPMLSHTAWFASAWFALGAGMLSAWDRETMQN